MDNLSDKTTEFEGYTLYSTMKFKTGQYLPIIQPDLCLNVSIMAKKSPPPSESDSAYFLKLVLYVLLGSFWLRFSSPIEIGYITLNGFPLGLLLGLLFARHDHFQIDRKVEYAILVLVTIITFFLPAGIVL